MFNLSNYLVCLFYMKENIPNSTTLLAKPRNYRCPCNKSYLSYPALFTHIKQKHNGKVLYLHI